MPKGSVIERADNSGGLLWKVVRVRDKIGKLGRVVGVYAKRVHHKQQLFEKLFAKSEKVKRIRFQRQVHKLLIVNTKRPTARPDGTFIRFDSNRGIVMKRATGEFKGSLVFGPICKEIRGPWKDIRYRRIITHSRLFVIHPNC